MIKSFKVEKNEAKLRLDSYISQKDKDISRTAVKRLLEEEKIKVNNKEEKLSYKVQENDEIEIQIDPPKEIKLEAQNIPIDIIYEDNEIGRASCRERV